MIDPVHMPRGLSQIPAPLRHAVAGAGLLGIPGCFSGLTVGLVVDAPTAWFAAFELGVPAAIVGGIAGLSVSPLTKLARSGQRRT
jgi:hypothetical protein